MTQRGLRAGSETGSLVNHVSSMQGREVIEQIEIGDGATILMWSDRKAATVIEKRPGRYPVVVIQEDRATRTDDRGFSEMQDYRYERNPAGAVHEVSFRRGAWRVRGSDNGVRFGVRETYRDPSF